jgi:hypothetical protein
MCVTTPSVERKPDARIGLMPTGVPISSSNTGWTIEAFAVFPPKTIDQYFSNSNCEIDTILE